MRNDYTDNIEACPIGKVQKIIRGKWTMVIIYHLSESHVLRFSELKRKMPQVTEANLTKELRTLESYGIIHREIYREVPPRVEYSLTKLGKSLKPILDAMQHWGEGYKNTLA